MVSLLEDFINVSSHSDHVSAADLCMFADTEKIEQHAFVS